MINLKASKLNLTPVEKTIDVILVPQGAEYQAVCRGLKHKTSQVPTVMPIPMGCQALKTCLENWKQSRDFLNKPPKNVLLMGLCGGLSPQSDVGKIVIYSGCGYPNQPDQLLWQECDRDFMTLLQHHLKDQATVVKGLTSDRLIWLALEKQNLYQQYQMDVVDMEGFIALNILTEAEIKVGMIRVISDESKQDLPNITSAISANGALMPLPLAISMIKNPIASFRLIQGSLEGLIILEKLSHQLFNNY